MMVAVVVEISVQVWIVAIRCCSYSGNIDSSVAGIDSSSTDSGLQVVLVVSILAVTAVVGALV